MMLFVRIVVSLVLLGLLMGAVDLSSLRNAIAAAPATSLMGATATIAATAFPFAWRWQLLCRANAVALSWHHAFIATLHAYFFNQALVSSLGGDAYRVWYLTQQQHKLHRALSCILADRLVGLFGLLVLVIIGQPILVWLSDDLTLRRLAIALGLAILTGLLILQVAPLRQLSERVQKGAKWAEPLIRALELLRDPSPKRQRALKYGLLLAIAAQLLLCAGVWLLGRGLALDLPWWLILATFPAVYFVSLIPITLGGWGSREGAMIASGALIGVASTDALALSVLFGLCMLFIGLIGGLFFVASKAAYPNSKKPINQDPSQR